MPQTPWTRVLDYGYPDMTTVDDDAWAPALRAAAEQQREQVAHIAAETAPASVANVLHAFARSGQELDRLHRAFLIVTAAEGTEQRQRIRAELAPELTAHTDWLSLHPGLYARFRELQDRVDAGEETLTEEQRWFLAQQLLKARVAGAGLPEADQEQLRILNQQLAQEETAYSQLQVHEAARAAVLIETAAELAGLSAGQVSAARAAAQQAGHPLGYLLRLSMPVQQPALASLTRRETRRKVHRASVERGSLVGEDGRTTRQIGAQIAVLRARKARLLGFENFLESVLPLRTAASRTEVETMLRRIVEPAVQRVQQEAQQITSHLGYEPEPWDVSYGVEQIRRSHSPTPAPESGTGLDEALGQLFDAAHRAYGITVVERDDLPGYVPGARSFEVFDAHPGAPGTGLGLFLLDVYSRDTKSGGAWMNGFSVPSTLWGSYAVVTNNLNVAPPAAGEPTVLTRSEKRTLFHEFGHALHALLAEAEFAQLSGTAVPRDNVEFPSQVNEVFQELYGDPTPPGAVPTPQHLWGKGCSTAEHVAAVAIDLAWHTLSPETAAQAARDPEGFENRVLTEWGLNLSLVPPRYHGGCFKHIFASAGYAAGYYSYLWAEVLAADVSEWFREVLSDSAALAERGAQFRRELLSRGHTRDPSVSFRAVLGRDPSTEPLLRSLVPELPSAAG
ncbi:M3 family metallopeptidase [Nesterenkonia sphaerica]|uniref:M3 family metallopeptidase n=1 Tax=Nesterenkonia sphaerica TaxID=1804988 RepID=A0A5R9AN34_9MICC|nr:M3 family metallopeptidase [Nesterenkonia sphaerica]TLP79544.1 M3 family metallopeptidase [Nesterenkonia sphaerica]